jgi:large subunit ribosomal protein L10
VFTDLDAFDLYKVMEEGKIPAPIKAGAVAPHDIVVEQGPTSLKPGPVVGELQNLGIPAGISGGKVEIKQRKVAVKEGEKVSASLAEMLAKLEIYPVTEGLDLRAVYDAEGETVFTPDVLHIDPTKYFADIKEGIISALALSTHIKYEYPTSYTIGDLINEASIKSQALALDIAYPTSLTIKPLIRKAYSDARNLSINACIYEPETIEHLLAKARSQAQGLTVAAHLSE